MKEKLYSIIFVMILCSFMLLSIILPDQDVSIEERRKLAQFPKFNVNDLFEGDYFSNLNDYFVEQFPLRQNFRNLKGFVATEIFKKQDDDEIILCLNYDGLYGINSINYYLQSANSNKSIDLDLGTYKVGDPIVFGDNNRFSPVIYNNLKGRIIDIEEDEKRIWFSIEIDKVINELEIQFLDLELIGESENDKSIVKFYVNKYRNADEDNDSDLTTIVPFSVAYAVSIHKSQGLEYNSVKIIITNEIDNT